MKTSNKKEDYVEWLNAEVMHKTSKNWLSELNFIKDEQLFFDDLVKSYTLQLIDSKHFEDSKKIVNELSDFQVKTNLTIEKVIIHEKELKIMVDETYQHEEEENYKKDHRYLIGIISKFTKDYRAFKRQLFTLVKNVMKEGKQKRLLN